ncbi:MAG: hypothetical protein JXD19_11080 [Deltaproteobacteria bacterium]|nr:hypothetical protein [Deltaproteobacteria bacterium]
MLDVSVSYNRYKFLGFEFLTWLWFLIDNDQETIKKTVPGEASLAIGNRIVLVNTRKDAVETVLIKGEEADLQEGIVAMRKGAVVAEVNLSYRNGDQEWRFTLKGESLGVSDLVPPATAPPESPEDAEGVFLEKVYLYESVLALIDKIFQHFIKERVSPDWNRTMVPRIRKWISS